jgi:hypothetical protein
MVIVNGVLAAIVSPFAGLVNLDEGILSTEGIKPIGAGLHEPVVICLPSVMGVPGAVRQKLIKLFVEVNDATWPSTGTSCPSLAKPLAITPGLRAGWKMNK